MKVVKVTNQERKVQVELTEYEVLYLCAYLEPSPSYLTDNVWDITDRDDFNFRYSEMLKHPGYIQGQKDLEELKG